MDPPTGDDAAVGTGDLQFEAFLSTIGSEQMPDEIKQQIVTGLRAKYETPPVEAAEAVLRRAIGESRVRQLLYYPTEEDIRAYPQLLQPPPKGAPKDHPQARMQIHSLTTLFLAHCRSWNLMKPFIESGGLLALVGIMRHENNYLRGQAFEVMINIQNEELYPWHDPPALSGGRSVTQGPDAGVWSAMFSLSRTPLMAALVENSAEPFPGAAFMALRVMAYYCSWLRRFYCKDNILRLSQELLDLLKEWPSRREGAIEEEIELAKKLFEDFSRFPAAHAAEGASVLGKDSDDTALDEADLSIPGAEDGEGTKTGFDKSFINHDAAKDVNEAEDAKQLGNAAFKEGRWSDAIRHYSLAIDLPVPNYRILEEGPRRSIYHSNRAAAYLGRAAAGGGRAGEMDESGHLMGRELGTGADVIELHFKAAQLDCNEAIQIEPGNVKARYRLAQALKGLGKTEEALKATTEALDRAPPEMRPQLNELRRSLMPFTDVEDGLDELD